MKLGWELLDFTEPGREDRGPFQLGSAVRVHTPK